MAINSADVPVIFTNNLKDTIIAIGKIDEFSVNTRDKLQLTLNNLAAQNNPIEIDLGDGSKDYIFYAPSELITRLKYYPYIQFGVIGLFLIIAYILFSTARKVEQDQVWVGMSKETAHQLARFDIFLRGSAYFSKIHLIQCFHKSKYLSCFFHLKFWYPVFHL